MPGIMNESDFHRGVDAVLARIEEAAEAHDDLDVDLESGILTLTCPDGSRVIVNRQTRSGEELFASLTRIVAAQGGAGLAWK